MIASSPVSWTTQQVPGHQDNNPTAELDWWARQSIQMDNLAKLFWMQHSHSAPAFCPITDKGFQAWPGNCKLSSHQPSTFFDHTHGKTILNWRASHNRFPACHACRIDWDVCATALKRLPMGQRRWVSKHTSGCCGVGSCKLVKWKEQPTSECPPCGEHENASHV